MVGSPLIFFNINWRGPGESGCLIGWGVPGMVVYPFGGPGEFSIPGMVVYPLGGPGEFSIPTTDGGGEVPGITPTQDGGGLVLILDDFEVKFLQYGIIVRGG